MTKWRILVCGLGGIGSFLVGHLHRLAMNSQIELGDVDITMADPDQVEMKNIKYQNFGRSEIMQNKATALEKRYSFRALSTAISSVEDIKDYNLIILCVDNNKTRKLVYEYCLKNSAGFIDLRAEGRAVAVFSNTDKHKIESLIKDLDTSVGNTSCQLDFELKNGIIQNGNIIAAAIGSQMVLNKLRGEKNPAEFRAYF